MITCSTADTNSTVYDCRHRGFPSKPHVIHVDCAANHSVRCNNIPPKFKRVDYKCANCVRDHQATVDSMGDADDEAQTDTEEEWDIVEEFEDADWVQVPDRYVAEERARDA